jgi:thiamine phosphate synthase YjbQ (UPF0047 family)
MGRRVNHNHRRKAMPQYTVSVNYTMTFTAEVTADNHEAAARKALDGFLSNSVEGEDRGKLSDAEYVTDSAHVPHILIHQTVEVPLSEDIY